MSEDEEDDDRYPRFDDDDDVWQRWIEKQSDELEIVFGDEAPEETDEQVEWLSRLTDLLSVSSKRQQIRKLYFEFCGLRPDDCSELNMALCALVSMLHSQLESLTFKSFTNELSLIFRFVPTIPKLLTLGLSDTACTGQGARIAELLRKCPNLTSLCLSDCNLNDFDFDAIRSVACSSLEIFDISKNDLTDLGMRSVARMINGCQQIREVYLCDIEPGDDFSGVYEALASLADKPRLERLHFGGSVLAADELLCLQKLEHLKDLSIFIVGTDSDFECLCDSLRRLRNLSKLGLYCENGFSLENDRVFVDVLRSLGQLVELRFTSAESSASFKHLGEYISSSGCRLRMLQIRYGVGRNLLPVVSGLRFNSSLTSFGLWDTESDANDIAMALAQALPPNRTLREFYWTSILSPQNWTMVVEAARFSAIESLSIRLQGELNDQMYRLLEDVANQGYLVSMGSFWSTKSCTQRMELNKRMHVAARKATLTMLAVRKFRKSALNFLQYDIVKMIAMSLCATRANRAWSNALGVRKELEQKKQKM